MGEITGIHFSVPAQIDNMWVLIFVSRLAYKSLAILNLGISIEIIPLCEKVMFISTRTKQLPKKKKKGQDFLMAILMISMCSKNMHILPLSSLISPVTKMNVRN